MMAATCRAFKVDIIAQPSLKKARQAGLVPFPPPALDHRRLTCSGKFPKAGQLED